MTAPKPIELTLRDLDEAAFPRDAVLMFEMPNGMTISLRHMRLMHIAVPRGKPPLCAIVFKG